MTRPRPCYNVITLDETSYWDLSEGVSPDDLANLERIETVYLYDSTQRTYCAEMTPSYWLVPVETREIWKDDYEPATDDLNCLIYGNGGDADGMYMHVPVIDRLVKQLSPDPFRTKRLGSMGYRDPVNIFDLAGELSANGVI